MTRGTTPKHTFISNVDLTGAKVFVTYSQNGETVVEKTTEDCDIEKTMISCSLTQEDTLKFDASNVAIQVRYVMADGAADASQIIVARVNDILKDGTISYDEANEAESASESEVEEAPSEVPIEQPKVPIEEPESPIDQ